MKVYLTHDFTLSKRPDSKTKRHTSSLAVFISILSGKLFKFSILVTSNENLDKYFTVIISIPYIYILELTFFMST